METEQEQHYILFNGVRIGFFQNKEDAINGLKENNKGMVISEADYKKYYEVKHDN